MPVVSAGVSSAVVLFVSHFCKSEAVMGSMCIAVQRVKRVGGAMLASVSTLAVDGCNDMMDVESVGGLKKNEHDKR